LGNPAEGPRPLKVAPRGGAAEPSSKIFINYRREDVAGHARLLYERLVQGHFARKDVFLDVETVGLGIEWLNEIKAQGAKGGVFLALIGPHWLDLLKRHQSARIETGGSGGTDWAREEIEWALHEWPGVVVPVVVDGVMPEASVLPRSIRALASKNGFQLRNVSFDEDAATLIVAIEGIARSGSADNTTSVGSVDNTGASAPDDATGGGSPHDTDADDAGDGAQPRSGVHPKATAPIDALPSGVMAPGEDHYTEVAQLIVEGGVVPFLGSHVCGAMPDAGELAAFIATELDLPELVSHYDLAEVAQYVTVTKGDVKLRNAIMKAIRERHPGGVHRFLAGLPKRLEALGLEPAYQMIVTSNYDDALEQAFEEQHEPFDLAVYSARTGQFVHYPWTSDDDTRGDPIDTRGDPIAMPDRYGGFPIDPDEGTLERTVIVKIYGGMGGALGPTAGGDGYVVTEDQYIDYLPDIRVVPVQILNKLRDSQNLFIGWRMRNWNERVFLRRLWQDNPLKNDAWAIEDRPDEYELRGWRMYPRIQLFGAAAPDYAGSLAVELDRSGQAPV
jgi:hypothetical protein